MKFQIPSSKLQRVFKFQASKQQSGNRFWIFKFGISLALGAWCLVLFSGCRRDMFNQPKSNPLSQSDFFQDGMNSRPIPPHTVACGDLENDEAFYTGKVGTNLVADFPIQITRAVLERGQQRYDIYCMPCHGETGDGNGIVVARGFPSPPSYHIERLRNAPVGHFFNVMTHGYGAMYSYASRVTPEDRWAIAAYIRALQLSERATLADVPTNEIAKLTGGATSVPASRKNSP
jgi:mono/diheme cytochrome c family protein